MTWNHDDDHAAALAAKDAEIRRLDAQWEAFAEASEATRADLADEAEALREDVVWAVSRRAHLELSPLQSGVDLVSEGAYRIPVDERLDSSILAAVRKAREETK